MPKKWMKVSSNSLGPPITLPMWSLVFSDHRISIIRESVLAVGISLLLLLLAALIMKNSEKNAAVNGRFIWAEEKQLVHWECGLSEMIDIIADMGNRK